MQPSSQIPFLSSYTKLDAFPFRPHYGKYCSVYAVQAPDANLSEASGKSTRSAPADFIRSSEARLESAGI